MNLDLALERLRDLPVDELLAVGRELQREKDAAVERWKKAEFEIVRRQDEQDSTLLMGEAAMVETKWAQEYEWDTEVVRTTAPAFVHWVEPVGGYFKVDTVKLNNQIRKLGNSPEGQLLKQARRVKRKYATLKFTDIIDSRGEE